MANDGEILIEWYAVQRDRGWLPATRKNGRESVEWSSRGYERSTAEAMAESIAKGEAARYTGDWDITVRKGASTDVPADNEFHVGDRVESGRRGSAEYDTGTVKSVQRARGSDRSADLITVRWDGAKATYNDEPAALRRLK